MIYIVIPVFNRLIFTAEVLKSLDNQSNKDFVTVVVDHGSTDGTDKYISSNHINVVVLKGNSTMWWTAATNLGVNYALQKKATYILTLNNDLILDPNYIENIIGASKLKPESIIGSVSLDIKLPKKIVYAGTKWDDVFAKYGSIAISQVDYQSFQAENYLIKTDLLPGRGTLIPASVFSKIGIFNEKYFPHYMADEDFSLRAKKVGYSLLICSKAILYSHVDDTGLNTIHNGKRGLKYLVDTFTSIRSPNKLSVRWHFSKHARYPLMYFTIDLTRVFASQILKSLR